MAQLGLATASATVRARCRGDSSSAWPVPGPSSTGRLSIFADEPTGNLDSNASTELLAFLQRSVRRDRAIRSSWSPTIRTVPSYADRVVFLADGRVVDELEAPTADSVLERMRTLGA